MRRVSGLIEARLYQLILHSVFPVSCSTVRHMVCRWCSPRCRCIKAANHATDRLEILRVSGLEVDKEGRL